VEFSNLTHALIFSMLLVFFILPERNIIFENFVSASKEGEFGPVNFCFNFKWGSEGSANGKFLRSHDVNFDSKGNVYVSDRDRNDIQKFTPNGTFLMKWGSEGSRAGQFNVPYSIEVDIFDNIYVVDRGNDRIQKFDENGTFVKQWDRSEKINGIDQEFGSPEDMVINQKTGVIYITDTGNERIVKLDKNFPYILQWGSVDGIGSNETGKFNHPHGIDVDSKGYVYVNELENPRIQVFDNDGNFTTSFGTSGIGDGQFSKPEHVNIDSSGNIYVVDRGNQRMQVFSPC